MMLVAQRSRGFRSALHRAAPTALLLVLAVGLPSCGDDVRTSAEPEVIDAANEPARDAMPLRCLWEADELLSLVDAPAPNLEDCGVTLRQNPLENECFASGLEANRAVQVTINNCIDCVIYSTYVSTPSAGKFHLYREADYYGDDVRVVNFESCTDFVPGEGSGANCAEPSTLYSCSDPLPEVP